MKNIFKRLNLILLLFMIVVSLVACSTSKDRNNIEEENTEKLEAEKEDNLSEVSIFIPGYEEEKFKPLYDASIEDFRQENVGVEVNVVPANFKDANITLMSLIQAGKTPDVIITDSRYLREFAEIGAVAKLDSFMTDEFKEKRIEEILKTANINESQYGIPFSISSKALYYRSDLIKVPPTNWHELLETAKKVKSEHPDMYGFSINTDVLEGSSEILNFIYQNGGTITDLEGNIKLNTKENIDTLNYLKEFQTSGVIADPIGTSKSSQIKMFQKGDLAMFISGPLEDKLNESIEKAPYKVALLPQGKNMAISLDTYSFSISQTSKKKELAWNLIEFMGQFEYQNTYDLALGLFPVLKEEKNEVRYNEGFLKPFEEMTQHRVIEPQVESWDTFNKIFIESVQRVLGDKGKAEDVLDNADKTLNN